MVELTEVGVEFDEVRLEPENLLFTGGENLLFTGGVSDGDGFSDSS